MTLKIPNMGIPGNIEKLASGAVTIISTHFFISCAAFVWHNMG
jgi:hypothetical protein